MIAKLRPHLPLVVVVIALAILCAPTLFGKYPMDLQVYRLGGRAVLDGQSLYDVRLRVYGFTYPPFAAVLFTAFGAVTLPAAMVLLTVLSLVSLLAFVRLCVPRFPLRTESVAATIALGVLLVCEPVRSTVFMGQINLVLAVLVARDLLGRRGRWSGVGVGLAAAVKLTPAVFVLYLLLRGRREEARNAVGAFLVLTAGALVLMPSASVRFWTHEIFAGSGIGDPGRTANQSLRGALWRLFGEHPASVLWAVLLIPTLAIGLYLARAAAERDNEVLAVGIVGFTGCLVSPISWTHHWVWCVPWLVGLARAGWLAGGARRVWLLVATFVFVATNFIPEHLIEERPAARLLVGNAYVLVAVLSGLGALAGFLHSRRPSARLELALD